MQRVIPSHQIRRPRLVAAAAGIELLPYSLTGPEIEMQMAAFDRTVDAYIRGIHYIGAGPQEDEPPAGDILNPEAVASFLHLVYDRYAEALGDHFGSTILVIFTDEPGPLGKCRERGVVPGTTGIMEHINAYLGGSTIERCAACDNCIELLIRQRNVGCASFDREYVQALKQIRREEGQLAAKRT